MWNNLITGPKYKKSKYMVRFSISKNPIYSFFVEIKQSLILDPDLDQLENWAHNKNLSTCSDSAYQRTPRIPFCVNNLKTEDQKLRI